MESHCIVTQDLGRQRPFINRPPPQPRTPLNYCTKITTSFLERSSTIAISCTHKLLGWLFASAYTSHLLLIFLFSGVSSDGLGMGLSHTEGNLKSGSRCACIIGFGKACIDRRQHGRNTRTHTHTPLITTLHFLLFAMGLVGPVSALLLLLLRN